MKKTRCDWVPEGNELYEKYHDEEWGVPVHSDRKHFEFLVLEGAQAGLSWETILKRRKGYKKAFANFDPEKIARFSKRDYIRLVNDEGIIRNKLKIQSAINNAKAFLKVQKEFGSFDKYVWEFVGGMPIINKVKRLRDYKAETEESRALSKDLKKRGFSFVGPTIIYAHMQAVGMVNDHMVNCFRYKELKEKK